MNKFNFIIFLFLSLSPLAYGQEYADKIDAVFDNPNAVMKGKIETENNMHKLHFYDKYEKDSIVSYFQEKGYQGGGASWLAIIYVAFNTYEENLIDLVKYDAEASGITFKSDTIEDLQMISKVIGLIKTDQTVLDALVDEAVKLKIMK